MRPDTNSQALTNDERRRLREAAEREGLEALATRLGVHQEPIARAVAGFGVRRGTIALIRAGLEQLADSNPPPRAA